MRIKIGVSRCLLGDEVRYDGGHRRDRYVVDVLGAHVEWVPVCPEVEIGLPVPRPTIRLVQVGGGIRVVGTLDPSRDVTDRLEGLYPAVADRFDGVSGFILKRGSPSCGTRRVKVYDADGRRIGWDAGRFARGLLDHRPTLPVEEEGRLDDARLRENFITRVFAFRRWQELRDGPVDVPALRRFHARHELLLMAHNQAGCRRLGRRVDAARPDGLEATLLAYEQGFMATLQRPATPRSHGSVLRRILGCLEQAIDRVAAAELVDAIDRYAEGLLPRLVPLTLLRHHARRHPDPRIVGQVYLDPHPAELMLHNHV